jgi:hypothetical protein
LEEVTEEEIKPKPKTVLRLSPQDVSNEYGLGPVPKQADKLATVKDYYIRLTNALGEDEIQGLTKKELLSEIKNLLSQSGENLLK